MKQQKIVALLLVAAIMLPMCMTSFAAGEPVHTELKNGATIKIDSDLQLPTFRVTIGPSAKLVVNPYHMKFDKDGDGTKEAADSFYSAPTSLRNESDIKVKVKATPSATTDSNDLQIVTVEPADDVAVPSIYMKYTMKSGLTSATDYQTFDGTGTVGDNYGTAIIKKDGANVESCEMIMAAATPGTNEGDPSTPTYGAIKILGKSAGPNADWDAADTVNISIVFDISAVIDP